MQEKMNPLWVFISAFGVSSFAGLASLLRAGKQVNALAVFSAILNSGMLGLGIALVWYTKFQDNIYFLIGVCVLAGLGGVTVIDFVIEWAKGGGLPTFLKFMAEASTKKDTDKKDKEEKKDEQAK